MVPFPAVLKTHRVPDLVEHSACLSAGSSHESSEISLPKPQCGAGLSVLMAV